jgi:hypothetical protein
MSPLRRGQTPEPTRGNHPYTEKEKAEAREYADFYVGDKGDEYWQKLYESKLKVIRSE